MESQNPFLAAFTPQPKRIKVDTTHSDLGEELWEKREEFGDVVLVVDRDEFPAHKSVLASKYQYFRSLFYGKMKEKSKKIKLPLNGTAKASTFRRLLKYAYTDKLEIEEQLDEIIDITTLADFLGFTELKSRLIKIMVDSIQTDNVLEIYKFSNSVIMEGSGMKKKCLSFFEDHSKTQDVLKSSQFLELSKEHLISLISRDTFVAPEVDILEAVRRWISANVVEDVAEVTRHIQLSRFTPLEIFTVVKPTGLFTHIQLLEGVGDYETTAVSEMSPRGRCSPEKNLIENIKDIDFDNNYGGKATIELDEAHLVNFLSFETHNDLSTPNRSKWYSYSVKVYLDNPNGLEIFNNTQCSGQQKLFFPTIPVKKVEVHISSIEEIEMNSYFESRSRGRVEIKSHKVSTLKFTEKSPSFKFINQVIAPLNEYEVEFTKLSTTNKNDCLTIEAYFNQPYSASTLMIEVSWDDPQCSPKRIEAEARKMKDQTDRIWRLNRHNIGYNIIHSSSPIQLTLTRDKDMVIGYVKVNISPTGRLAPDKHPTIKSIKCKSSATRDEVNMDEWGPYIRATT